MDELLMLCPETQEDYQAANDIADNFYTLKDVLTPDEYYDAIFCIQEEEE